jgi:hypothetical protein
MVQVFGTTYRIVEVRHVHHVFRLLDDRFVGSFLYARRVSIVESHLEPELLGAVAREALRCSLVAWTPVDGQRKVGRLTWLSGMREYLRETLASLRAEKPGLSRRLA